MIIPEGCKLTSGQSKLKKNTLSEIFYNLVFVLKNQLLWPSMLSLYIIEEHCYVKYIPEDLHFFIFSQFDGLALYVRMHIIDPLCKNKTMIVRHELSQFFNKFYGHM